MTIGAFFDVILDISKTHSERITKADKKMINDLDYDIFGKTEKKNNICINVFFYENKLTFPVYVSHQKFNNLYGFIDNNK